MDKTDSFMHLLEQDLEKRRGRDHPLRSFWMEGHRNAIKKVSNQFSFFVKQYLPPDSSEMRCLDLGCGTGPASIVLALNGHKVVGLEYKKENGLGLKLAKVRAKEHEVAIDFVQGNGYTLPFKDDVFDFVFCSQVIEHVEKKDKFIEEMYRVLSPGGIVYISTPNRLWYKEGHSGLLFAALLPHNICKKYVKWRGRICQENEWDVWHPDYWSYTRLLKRTGFKILANISNYIVYKYPKARKIRILLPFIKYVAPQVYILQK